MDSNSIRRSFIDFFRDRGHIQLPSAPLVPVDPNVTTLFTIAGMQQMIPYFLGREQPPARRMVTVQKALRTNDIEEVGDASHLTFLEMLGNFSVGDYFKHEAVAFTWEFLTGTMGIPADRWWATIYPGDEVTRQAWLDVGMAAEHIVEFDGNWWQQGPVGPCGTDSEIHYDRGVQYGCGHPDCRPERDCCDRFLETWNDVFMQYFRDENGELHDLPFNNIDTGMGFERLTMIVQGKQTVYETDLFQPIIQTVAAISGTSYGQSDAVDRSLRIIADHSRAITFLISERVMPSAEGRGYVLRRLLRRAALHGRLLGIGRPFLTHAVSAVIGIMGSYYVELEQRRDYILHVVQQEEERFSQTLARGLSIFEDMAERARAQGVGISGHDAFLLYDTHGFPLEMTEELAQERSLTVDRAAFEEELRRQRERASATRTFTHQVGATPETYAEVAQRVGPVLFTGYEELQTTTTVVGILAEGQPVMRAEAGDEVEFILARTPFYAESGGQVGDTGVIRSDSGTAIVTDTQRPQSSLIVEKGRVESGSIAVGDIVEAEVNVERRLHILPHHSGTHLLHKALQEVLGPEATQAGSLVAPDHLRFDFRWPRPLSDEELREVQDRINAAIWANLPVETRLLPYDEAIRQGAMALFGEKYGDTVRVVSMGDWSKELCGGTHVNATGDIGVVIITAESSTGSGVRRIEALAGAAAYAYLNSLRDTVHEVAGILETRPDNVVHRARQIMEELREQQRRIEALTQQLAQREAEALLRQGISVDGLTVVADKISADSVEELKATTDAVRERLGKGIVVLASVVDGKPQFAMAVTRNLKDRGLSANQILREAARQAQGGAGGTPEYATGGGKDAAKVDAVLQTAVDLIKQRAGQAE